ncbi:MAG TPA: methyltransferase domain-containing protein [Bryobacteraceae bacterium]|nr:methyltransferase domain-containing protein [Bryobacteraceae bacterium]
MSGTAFDQLAPTYDAVWTDAPRGRAQRDRVWRDIDPLFRSGDHVLDLGCGTGEDAAHLESKGVHVHAIDASAEMIRVANTRGVQAQLLRIEDLGQLDRQYDGAISNFGALNCVADLPGVGLHLARLIRPGGWLAISIMPAVCWAEILRFQFRRLRGTAQWRGMRVYYPFARAVIRAFPGFTLVRRRSLAWGDHCFYLFIRK